MANVQSLSMWQELYAKGVHAMVEDLDHEETVKLTNQYGSHNYKPLPVTVAKGDGPYVEDSNGRTYLDCVGSYSAMAHGHLSEYVVGVAQEQLKRLTLTSRAVYTRELALFLKALSQYTGMDMSCPMNTGTEAVETALKFARKWGYATKGIPKDQAEIIVAVENFHGRSTTIIGFSSEEKYKVDFGPFTPGFKLVPFGEIDALKAAITPNTAAILFEPIQAEAGILFAPDGFLAAVRKLCTENNVLLIWDEIQTGFCRTGKKFAWQHEDAEPDLITLGKALGGGLIPVSAVAGKKEIIELFKPGDHGSTFGGNPIAAAIGIAAMAELEVLGLEENSRAMGERLKKGFENLNHPAVLEVRGKGLLVGLEVKEGTDTKKLTESFMTEGILTKETRHHTFRFAPPLIIKEAVVDDIILRTKHALDSVL